MSRPQIRIRPGAALDAALRATGGDEFPTGRINSLAERYLVMIEAERPALARNEWLAIFDALSGVGMEDLALDQYGSRAWNEIVPEIMDATGLAERWDIDPAALAEKVHAMSVPARIAIVETAQRFWSLSRLPDSQALDLATQHPATWPPLE